MGLKLNIVTIDDGVIEKFLGSTDDALDYIIDNVDPSLVAQMTLTTPTEQKISGYYTICEKLVKKEVA